jgi:phosphoglycolate phosphatase-like HAD superfamily hydrolase
MKARFLLVFAIAVAAGAQSANDPLPSWNNAGPKQSLMRFVSDVTTQGGAHFVPVPERIAVFDNDGTLWTEQPMYNQLAFVLARVAQMAPQHPEWKTTQPFKGVLEHDAKAAAASGEAGMVRLLAATHSGMTTDEFRKTVSDWIATARHPRFHRPYTECVYQPMLEVLTYLRANGFKTFIVSGGGVEFMRPWTEKTYGIPPEQVVGSSGKTQFKLLPSGPVLVKLPQVEFVDDGAGKPSGINRFIGRHPIAAFGNSDGDLQMLEWTAANPKAEFVALVHHTDATREYAYDRQSSFGKLDKALDEARAKRWTVIDMKSDWKTIFPNSR